jgi:DNA-binding MarR family transcriptional regulator
MLQEQEYVGLLIGAARRSIKQAVQRAARPLRLTPPQFWFVNAVRELPGASLGEVARRQNMDSPTASRIAESLEQRGFLRIEADRDDRRVIRLALTTAGMKLSERIAPIAASVRTAAVQGMSAREQDALRAALRKVVQNLEGFGGEQ